MSLPVYRVRPMTMQDLQPVQAIDRLSFSLPWPESAFSYELTQSDHSRNFVVEEYLEDVPPQVVAIAVVWVIVDEAHIATIAVHPGWRGRGLGKRLLEHILSEMKRNGMQTALLEVRAGNQVALQMYRRFGFEVVGRRPRYYKDNQEDALLMTLRLENYTDRVHEEVVAIAHTLQSLEESL